MKKKKNYNEDLEFSSKDEHKEDKILVVINRIENDTKVTINQFWAKEIQDDNKVAFWINEKHKFKEPLSDYYGHNMTKDIKKDKDKLKKKLEELKKIYNLEVDKKKPNPDINIRDIEHEIEIIKHSLFLLKFTQQDYSIITRNLENYRKIEYVKVGSKLYPLGFNSKLMTYFIIPIDKDITLDKHRENITIKHTTAFQKLIASATILMLILTIGMALVTGISAYKLYFAYDETKISELERACAGSAMTQASIYNAATTDFIQFVKDFQEQNKDLVDIKQVSTGGEKE